MSVKTNKEILKNLDFNKTDSKKLSDALDKEENITEELLYEFIYMAKTNSKEAVDFLKSTKKLPLDKDRILEQPKLSKYKEMYMKELLSEMKNKTVNSMEPCRYCKEREVISTMEQRRSADEEQNIKYECKSCGNTWIK